MIDLVAHSEAMREAVRLAERVAGTDANVLVTGESGVGKDAMAFHIHSKSSRATQPFVKIDCATLPSGLLEAELFGYDRGAFTGASDEKPGRLEASHRGTLVLVRLLLTFDRRQNLCASRDGEFDAGLRRTIRWMHVDCSSERGLACIQTQPFARTFIRLNVVHVSRASVARAWETWRPAQASSSLMRKHGRQGALCPPEGQSLLDSMNFPQRLDLPTCRTSGHSIPQAKSY